ncbi:MAG TPA: DUF2852 domain-containing protein [Roseiarcus sp.]|jgi:hypothetical protein
MSTAQGTVGGSNGAREFGPGEWSGMTWRRCGGSRWTPFELVAMILGFIVFWPIGLAILAYKFWQRKNGGEDLQGFMAGKWREARSAMATGPWSGPRGMHPWRPTSGNAAFDEWREAELARLEEERRKLEAAQREFGEYLDNVRKAKDREEFERFMNERRRQQPGQPS